MSPLLSRVLRAPTSLAPAAQPPSRPGATGTNIPPPAPSSTPAPSLPTPAPPASSPPTDVITRAPSLNTRTSPPHNSSLPVHPEPRAMPQPMTRPLFKKPSTLPSPKARYSTSTTGCTELPRPSAFHREPKLSASPTQPSCQPAASSTT